MIYEGFCKFFRWNFRSWEKVISKSNVRPNKNIVSDPQAIPKLHTRFYGNGIPDHHIVFNKNKGVDITVFAYFGTGKDYAILPYDRTFTNMVALHI